MKVIQSSSSQNDKRIDNLQTISSVTKAAFLLHDLSDLVKNDFTLMTFKENYLRYPKSLILSLRTITSQLESCVQEDMIPALHQISSCLKESLAILVECLENLNRVDNKTTFPYNQRIVMNLSSIPSMMRTCINSFEKVVQSLTFIKELSVELHNNIRNTLLGGTPMEKYEAQRARTLRNTSNSLNPLATTTSTGVLDLLVCVFHCCQFIEERASMPPTENTPSVSQQSMSDSTYSLTSSTCEMRTSPLNSHYHTISELYKQINAGIKLWTTMTSNIQRVDYKSLDDAFNLIYTSRKKNKAPLGKRKETILIYSNTISSVQTAVMILADINELLTLPVLNTASKSFISTKQTEV